MIPLLSSILPLILCQPQTQDIVLMPDALPVVGTSAVVSDSSVYQPMDKKEKDARITEMLLSEASQPIAPEFQPVDPSSLILHKTDDEGILRTEGSIYMIDKISNDLYFTSQSGSVSPLWDSAFAIQSMSNLLLGQISSPAFEIDLTHRCYGLEHPQLQLGHALSRHLFARFTHLRLWLDPAGRRDDTWCAGHTPAFGQLSAHAGPDHHPREPLCARWPTQAAEGRSLHQYSTA